MHLFFNFSCFLVDNVNEHQHPSPLAILPSIEFKHDLQNASALGIGADTIFPDFHIRLFLHFPHFSFSIFPQMWL